MKSTTIITTLMLLTSLASASGREFKTDLACFEAQNLESISVKNSYNSTITEKITKANLLLYTQVRDFMGNIGPVHNEMKMAQLEFVTATGKKGTTEGFSNTDDEINKFGVECDGGSMNIVRDSETGIATVNSRGIRANTNCVQDKILSADGATFKIVPCAK